MKEIRLSKLINAIRSGTKYEEYYFDLSRYMVYFIDNEDDVNYVDAYRITNIERLDQLLRHSEKLPVCSRKDLQKAYLSFQGIDEEYSYVGFDYYLCFNHLEEDYAKFSIDKYREIALNFCNEHEIVYIDDIR